MASRTAPFSSLKPTAQRCRSSARIVFKPPSTVNCSPTKRPGHNQSTAPVLVSIACRYEAERVSDAERDLADCDLNLETVKQWRHRIESQIADFHQDMHRLADLASTQTGSAQAFLASKIEILNRYAGGSASAVASVGLQTQSGHGRIDTGITIGADRLSSSVKPDDTNNRPELVAIANDPNVKTAIDSAWNDSNPNLPGVKRENGFWILRDDRNGTYSVQPFPVNRATNSSITPSPKPNVPGQTTVAFFHTHPNTPDEGYKQKPSKSDIQFAHNPIINIPGILKAHDRLHYFGPPLPLVLPENRDSIERPEIS
mgnify:CR=1 FL=1